MYTADFLIFYVDLKIWFWNVIDDNLILTHTNWKKIPLTCKRWTFYFITECWTPWNYTQFVIISATWLWKMDMRCYSCSNRIIKTSVSLALYYTLLCLIIKQFIHKNDWIEGSPFKIQGISWNFIKYTGVEIPDCYTRVKLQILWITFLFLTLF